MTMSKPTRKRSTPGQAQKRFDRLIVKLARTKDGESQKIIRKELAQVARILKAISREAKLERGSVWMPQSYVEERQAKIETAARISGRRAIRAHLVQGGAPGNGRGR